MQTSCVRWRHLVVVVALFGLAAGCTATEEITLNQQAIAAATATAVQESEPNDSAGGSDGDNGCTYVGLDSFGDMQLELETVATNTEQDDASIEYRVVDASGDVLVESNILVEDLKPGEELRFAVDTLEDGPADAGIDSGIRCEITEIEVFGFGATPFRAGVNDSCRLVEVDEFDDVQIDLLVTNPTNTRTELSVGYALRGPNEVRFADGVAFSTSVESGEEILIEVDTFTEFPEWADESSFSCEILSIEDF